MGRDPTISAEPNIIEKTKKHEKHFFKESNFLKVYNSFSVIVMSYWIRARTDCLISSFMYFTKKKYYTYSDMIHVIMSLLRYFRRFSKVFDETGQEEFSQTNRMHLELFIFTYHVCRTNAVHHTFKFRL